MKADEVMRELQQMGTAQNRKVYRRHGAGDNMFGVSFANLNKLRKRIKVDQDLADALWATGNVDARTLATMICDPQSFTSSKLDAWVRGLDYYMLVGLVAGVAARGRCAHSKADKWTKSKQEFTGQAGWDVVTSLAMKDKELGDDYFAECLETIERTIHAAPNRTRHAMNNALIAIGGSRRKLRKQAIAAARRIGTVEVDHGETGCKTPEAVSYIERMGKKRKG